MGGWSEEKGVDRREEVGMGEWSEGEVGRGRDGRVE